MAPSTYGNDADIDGSVTINESSADKDTRIESDGNEHMLFVDASLNRVGVGVSSPQESLDVSGSLQVNGDDVRIKLNGDSNSHPGLEFYENGTRKWIIFNDYTTDNLTFKTDSTVRWVINDDGHIGVGASSPSKTLTVEFHDNDTNIATGRGLAGATSGNGVLIKNTSTTTDAYANIDFRVNTADGRIAYAYDGTSNSGDFHFITDSGGSPASKMIISDAGDVAIGTSVNSNYRFLVSGEARVETNKYAGPALSLVNDGDNQYRYGLYIQAGTDDGTCTRGVRFYDGDGTEVGYISWSSGVLTYATFTGAHEAAVPASDYTAGQPAYDYGTIVKIQSTSDGNKPRQIEYLVAPTTTEKDKSAFGVYSSNMDPDELEKTNNHQVLALGDGHILVCNEGGNIEIGDYICSSNTQGHGMKQASDQLYNYTVAKATENVNWSSEGTTTKLISCTYHSA